MPPTATPEAGTPPSISVVLCAYTLERVELLAAAIDSLGAQTVAPHEIVLVIDHSPELEAEGRRRWPQAKIVPNAEQQGLSGARNTGLAESSGAVVAFLDDDAVPAPDWIERLGAAYAEARVLGAGGTVRPDWSAGRPRWFPPEFDWVVGCTHSGMPQETEAVRNLVGANMSFRREALIEAGGFRHELGRVGKIPAGCEETDLCIRIGQRHPEAEILYDPAAVVDHHVPAERGRFSYAAAARVARSRSSPLSSAATPAWRPSAPTSAAPCRWASCADSATSSAATAAASSAPVRSSTGSLPPPPASSAPAERRGRSASAAARSTRRARHPCGC